MPDREAMRAKAILSIQPGAQAEAWLGHDASVAYNLHQ